MEQDGGIRIAVIDDHAGFRSAVVDALSHEADMQVVGEAADAEGAIDLVQRTRPDIVVLDMNMPGGGLAVVARISASCPEALILLFTVVEDLPQIEAALRLGAGGYLRKGVDLAILTDSVRRLYGGETLPLGGPR